MKHAIAELEMTAEVAETNAPLDEQEGNVEQAALDREVAADCRAAIEILKGHVQ